MEPRQRHKRIPQRTCPAQRRPRNRASVPARFGAVALQCLAPAVQAQSDARGDVCDEREGDEEGFGDGGLVVRPCEQERAVCGVNGAGEEGDEGGVGDVEGGEDGEGVGGVALGACYWGGGVSRGVYVGMEKRTPPHDSMVAQPQS